MINRFMRIMVMFDLPVSSKKARKDYTRFRKFLINDGYAMMQFSVYSRITRNHDDAAKHINRLRANLPPRGSVRALTVTEKQYAAMLVLVGKRTATEDLLMPREILEL